jgi:hypothetical protein
VPTLSDLGVRDSEGGFVNRDLYAEVSSRIIAELEHVAAPRLTRFQVRKVQAAAGCTTSCRACVPPCDQRFNGITLTTDKAARSSCGVVRCLALASSILVWNVRFARRPNTGDLNDYFTVFRPGEMRNL